MINFSHKENNEAFMASEARKLLFVDNFLKKNIHVPVFEKQALSL